MKPSRPDGFNAENYYGVEKDAMPQWIALMKAQEENPLYPCLNNPYYYVDYGDVEYLSDDDVEALCYGCPLIKQCYDFAIANNEKHGVWGGILFSKDEDQLF